MGFILSDSNDADGDAAGDKEVVSRHEGDDSDSDDEEVGDVLAAFRQMLARSGTDSEDGEADDDDGLDKDNNHDAGEQGGTSDREDDEMLREAAAADDKVNDIGDNEHPSDSQASIAAPPGLQLLGGIERQRAFREIAPGVFVLVVDEPDRHGAEDTHSDKDEEGSGAVNAGGAGLGARWKQWQAGGDDEEDEEVTVHWDMSTTLNVQMSPGPMGWTASVQIGRAADNGQDIISVQQLEALKESLRGGWMDGGK